MKRLFATLALTAFALPATATHCTNGVPDIYYPTCVLPTQPSAKSDSTSSAKAGAIAGALAGSTSKATGGSANSHAQGGDSSALGGAGGALNDNSRSNMWVFPAPVFTPPLPFSDCPQANVTQQSVAIGWNFFSQASGSVNTDNCTAIILHNKFVESCQYESAQKILYLLSVKVLPGFSTESKPQSLNLTERECQALKAPPVKQTQLLFEERYTGQESTPKSPPVALAKPVKTKRAKVAVQPTCEAQALAMCKKPSMALPKQS